MDFDVLVVTALQDELSAVLSLTEADGALSFVDHKSAKWVRGEDPDGYPYFHREFRTESDEPLVVAAGRAPEMGETAAADRCRALVAHLQPLCVAMTGICAGRRGDVFLGDVIVASRLFNFDHGKLVTVTDDKGNRVTRRFREIETYNLKKTWAMEATDFAEEDLAWMHQLLGGRPLSLDVQRMWLLQTLLSHQLGNGADPASHPDRAVCCPRWKKVLAKVKEDKSVIVKSGIMELTLEGRELALNDRLENPDGPERDPAFKVHVGPIGSGAAVVQDSGIFKQLADFERKILGLEMEAAAIGYVAENVGIPSIVVKAVADYADDEKDDSFRIFATRASIAFLIAFLKRHPPRSLRRAGKLIPQVSPVLVSPAHAAQLRQIAEKWANDFSSLLKPAWSTHALTEAYLRKINADKQLLALRQHFPEVGRAFSDWHTLNHAMSGITTLPWAIMGQQGDKPTDPYGEALAWEHHDAVCDLVAELMEIQSRSVISGECDLCKKDGARE